MPLELHVVEFRAKDNLSGPMKGMSSEAKRAGETLKRTFNEPVQDSRRLQQSVVAIGGAMGAATLLAGRFGDAATSQARQVDALNRVYGTSSAEILKMTEAIQKNTNFSNDQARSAALITATLTNSYGLQTSSVEQLIARSADLAAVYGITLSDAVQRTSSAIRGEAESAEALGITLNDNYVATQAAARGLTGWTTTMTDAEKAAFRYTLIMEQTAKIQGTAADQADTARGKVIDFKDGLQDAGVAAGEFLGPIGEVASELGSLALIIPAATAAWGGLAGAFGGAATAAGAGSGAAGALTGLGAALAPVLAGALAFAPALAIIGYTAYTARDNIEAVTKQTNEFADALARVNAEAVKNGTATGGTGSSPGIDEAAGGIYGFVGNYSSNIEFTSDSGKTYSLESVRDELATLQGIYQDAFLDIAESMNISLTNPADDDIRMLIDQILYFSQLQSAAIQDQMELNRAVGLGLIETPKPFNPMAASRYYADTSGTDYTGPGATPYYLNGMPATSSNQIKQPGSRYYGDVAPSTDYSGPYQDNTSNRTVMVDLPKASYVTPRPMADSATYSTDAIKAYEDALLSASDAQSIFKSTQDGLIGAQSVYSAQQSEYSGQLNALTDGYEILQQRQADGVQLTTEEQALLNNYPGYYERLTGGVEDATVAEALLAAQYAENMAKGDEMNQKLGESAGATMGLVGIIGDLIFALEGVPTEVKTQIMLEDLASGRIDEYYQKLNALNGYSVTTYINQVVTGDEAGMAYHQHGGIVAARHGRVLGNNYTLVGEDGPELLAGGRGAGGMVIPASATRAKMRGQSGNGGITINGPVNVYANDPMQFQQQLRSSSIMEYRQ